MKLQLKIMTAAAVAMLLFGVIPAPGFGQCPCVTICPAGDGASIPGPPGGTKTPDLNGDGTVNLVDFSMFAACWPPGAYCFCADYDCNFIINLVDFATFASHWLHSGPIPGYNQPDADHYKTYEVPPVAHAGSSMILTDQFEQEMNDYKELRRVATPVSKNRGGMCDSVAHLTWWALLEPYDPEPLRLVTAQDQFGSHELQVMDSRFLLAPALKNDPTGAPPPEKNHYLCYEAIGDTISITVHLQDQFDGCDVFIVRPVFFCNPCEKYILPDGPLYPIIDDLAHMIVYEVINPNQYEISAYFLDQFGDYQLVLYENIFLIVPALKDGWIEEPQ